MAFASGWASGLNAYATVFVLGLLGRFTDASQVPAGFERFERLIELVGNVDDDRAQARQRWRHYADRGYAITHHDLAQRS